MQTTLKQTIRLTSKKIKMASLKTNQNPLEDPVTWTDQNGRTVEAHFECEETDQAINMGRKTIIGTIVSVIGSACEAILKIGGTVDNPEYRVDDIEDDNFK